MSQIHQEKQKKIFELTISTLKTMLTFATEVKIQKYLSQKNAGNFRDFEAELASKDDNSPIKGTGVLATRIDIQKSLPRYEQDFFLTSLMSVRTNWELTWIRFLSPPHPPRMFSPCLRYSATTWPRS